MTDLRKRDAYGYNPGLVVAGILLWALSVGLVTGKGNKAEIFHGPVGCVIHAIVIAFGLALSWWGFF
ncbi:MAG: hypothetical protein EON59_00820 [Alphaproteobacteria bacterium]|nr:MAG: hypothetical protein EON59_00820 [Alphaproteobacteria bacterium]